MRDGLRVRVRVLINVSLPDVPFFKNLRFNICYRVPAVFDSGDPCNKRHHRVKIGESGNLRMNNDQQQ